MKILLAIDGSQHSHKAVEEVRQRPWPPDSVVRVLTVVQTVPPPAIEFAAAGPSLEEVWQNRTNEADRLATGVAESLRAAGLRTETAVRQGEPRAEIVDEASDWWADLIVVGSHGHTGLKRWLLGSVTLSVVSHAPCSVEVVRRRERR